MTWDVGPELSALAALCKHLQLVGIGSEMRDSLPGVAVRTALPGVYLYVFGSATNQERQALIAELAEIAAELDALQGQTAELAVRVAPRSPVRLARPA